MRLPVRYDSINLLDQESWDELPSVSVWIWENMVARLYFVDGIENDKSSRKPVNLHAAISNELFVPTIINLSVAWTRSCSRLWLSCWTELGLTQSPWVRLDRTSNFFKFWWYQNQIPLLDLEYSIWMFDRIWKCSHWNVSRLWSSIF